MSDVVLWVVKMKCLEGGRSFLLILARAGVAAGSRAGSQPGCAPGLQKELIGLELPLSLKCGLENTLCVCDPLYCNLQTDKCRTVKWKFSGVSQR